MADFPPFIFILIISPVTEDFKIFTKEWAFGILKIILQYYRKYDKIGMKGDIFYEKYCKLCC